MAFIAARQAVKPVTWDYTNEGQPGRAVPWQKEGRTKPFVAVRNAVKGDLHKPMRTGEWRQVSRHMMLQHQDQK